MASSRSIPTTCELGSWQRGLADALLHPSALHAQGTRLPGLSPCVAKYAVCVGTVGWLHPWTSLPLLPLTPLAAYSPCSRTRDLYIQGMKEMPLLIAQMAPRARVPPTVYVPPPLQVCETEHGGGCACMWHCRSAIQPCYALQQGGVRWGPGCYNSDLMYATCVLLAPPPPSTTAFSGTQSI